MTIKDYWTQPPQAQDMLIASVQPTPAYLRPPRPKGCKCKVADAHQCWVKQHGAIDNKSLCSCACHYETGGFD